MCYRLCCFVHYYRNRQCSGFPSSAESLTLRELYQDIVTAIMYNTDPLALNLYSKKMISSSVRDKVLLQTLTPDIKASELLCAVEAEVKLNPEQFMTFVSTLREVGEPASFIDCADWLMQAKGIQYLFYSMCVGTNTNNSLSMQSMLSHVAEQCYHLGLTVHLS